MSTKRNKTQKANKNSAARVALMRAGVKAAPVSAFAFFVVSKGRAYNVQRVQSLFENTGVMPTWVVGTGEVQMYKSAGAENVVEGGKLTPSRNTCLDLAASQKKYCVQMSDDVKSFHYYESARDGGEGMARKTWSKPMSQQEANVRSGKASVSTVSPVGAAQIVAAFMTLKKAHLGGSYPCMNAGFAMNQAPVTTDHFIVGDFIVVDTRKPNVPRFDEHFSLKEDYDYTAQHLDQYGAVARVNRLLVKAQHRDNPGGAVADRTSKGEQGAIRRLHEKWPGVFSTNHRRPNEVIMQWRFRSKP
jgi:hypothetical protein